MRTNEIPQEWLRKHFLSLNWLQLVDYLEHKEAGNPDSHCLESNAVQMDNIIIIMFII